MNPGEWWQSSVEQAIEKTYYTGSIGQGLGLDF